MADIPHVRTRAGQWWKLRHFGPPEAPVPPLPGIGLWLEFTATEFAASLGCNSCTGTYELDGQVFRFVRMLTTFARCLDDAVMQQEYHYAQALRAVRTFARTDGTLSLFYEGGVLQYVAADIRPGRVSYFAAREVWRAKGYTQS